MSIFYPGELMADRIFAILALLVVLGYGWIAFTVIKAPFQYDPLGPESWPQILALVAALCCLAILFRPDPERFKLNGPTALKITLMLIALIGYAALFEPAGFLLATALFATLASLLLGAKIPHALLFGLVTGVLGYLVGAKLLALNLPAGLLKNLL